MSARSPLLMAVFNKNNLAIKWAREKAPVCELRDVDRKLWNGYQPGWVGPQQVCSRLVPLSQEPAAELGSEAKESFPVIRGVSSGSPSDRLRWGCSAGSPQLEGRSAAAHSPGRGAGRSISARGPRWHLRWPVLRSVCAWPWGEVLAGELQSEGLSLRPLHTGSCEPVKLD